MQRPDLSIIIPTLNEAEALPLLLDDLAHQEGLDLEVIIVDGGSVDTTRSLAGDFFASGRLSGTSLVGPTGRGRQMNRGALTATADWLLFLHADSRLCSTNQLKAALDFMHGNRQAGDSDTLAGHFPLRFDASVEKSLALYFFETKASLGRAGTVHGDQGMLLTRSFFNRVGPFREDLPIMEDASLAEAIHACGQWLLLPGVLVTSARRFQVEGLQSRQTLNALMKNFLAIGWLDFFAEAPHLYRQQDRTQALRLRPYFHLVRRLMQEMSRRERWRIWLATGAYVRSQAWQIGLFLDCRKAFCDGIDLTTHYGRWLEWFDRRFEPLTNHWVGSAITALLVRVWFGWQLLGKSDNSV